MTNEQMRQLSERELEQIDAGFSPLLREGDLTFPDNGEKDRQRDEAGGDKPLFIFKAKGEPLRTIE